MTRGTFPSSAAWPPPVSYEKKLSSLIENGGTKASI